RPGEADVEERRRSQTSTPAGERELRGSDGDGGARRRERRVEGAVRELGSGITALNARSAALTALDRAHSRCRGAFRARPPCPPSAVEGVARMYLRKYIQTTQLRQHSGGTDRAECEGL